MTGSEAGRAARPSEGGAWAAREADAASEGSGRNQYSLCVQLRSSETPAGVSGCLHSGGARPRLQFGAEPAGTTGRSRETTQAAPALLPQRLVTGWLPAGWLRTWACESARRSSAVILGFYQHKGAPRVFSVGALCQYMPPPPSLFLTYKANEP